MLSVAIDNATKINADQNANADTKECLSLMIKLAAADIIIKDIGTWLEAEYFDSHQVQLLRDTIEQLLSQVKRHVVRLTYCMLPPEHVLESMIAPENGKLYESIINRVFTSPDAFGRIGNWQELYQHSLK